MRDTSHPKAVSRPGWNICMLLPALLVTTTVHAAELRAQTNTPRPIAGHPVFDLRVGVNGVAQAEQRLRPNLCAEVNPVRRIGIEACGNGSGVLHRSEGADIAHFRLRGAPLVFKDDRVGAQLMVGVGFTEVQRTSDAPGFRFGSADTEQVEAAGPEVSLGFKARYWMNPKSHLVFDVVAGTAHIEGAPAVMGWSSPVVPFVSLTTGMGF